MGLFSKKPKPTEQPTTSETPATPPVLAPYSPGLPTPPSAAPQPMPTLPTATPPAPATRERNERPRPSKPQKSRKLKGGVDPVDFLALRSELIDLKARLDATEQAKVMVENRLAALDATTTAIASERHGVGDVSERIAQLETQLGAVAETANNAATTAANASAKATTAATVASAPSTSAEPDAELLARLDALAAKVDAAPGQAPQADSALTARVEELATQLEVQAAAAAGAAPDPDLSARLDQISARLDATPGAERLEALEGRIGELAAKAEQPVEAAPADPDTLARLDELAGRVGAIDAFGAQLSQLNARVTAQAEFGAQLSSLRDRISELNTDTDDRRAAALAATGEADLRDRVNAISDRIASTEGLAGQIAQLAERVAANDTTTRLATEQVAAIEQRLSSVSTELANQVSELGRDIDGLASRSGEVAEGTISDEVLDALRNAQVKLAHEQARYEIAFREDLAVLAEQVRRNAGF